MYEVSSMATSMCICVFRVCSSDKAMERKRIIYAQGQANTYIISFSHPNIFS